MEAPTKKMIVCSGSQDWQGAGLEFELSIFGAYPLSYFVNELWHTPVNKLQIIILNKGFCSGKNCDHTPASE